MPQLVERKLSANELNEFSQFADMGRELLGIDTKNVPPAQIVEAVDDYVYKLQKKYSNPLIQVISKRPDVIDIALALGIVWGNQLVRLQKWQWTCIVSTEGESYGVASLNRSMIIYPTYYLKACLEDPRIDCVAALSFNMLAAGSIPKFAENEYKDVLKGVLRIVPRA